MAVVVLLLFAVGLAGAVGFQVVQAEARLALQGQETVRAFTIANGALDRYVGSQAAVPVDSVFYDIGGGEALVTARKVLDLTPPDELWVIRAEGRFGDPRIAGVPAARTVRVWATLRKAPVGVLGAFNSSADPIQHDDFQLTGYDQAAPGECAWAGSDEAALVGGGSLSTNNPGMLDGSPGGRNLGSTTAFLDSMNVDWAVLTDASYQVDYDGVSNWPDFSAIPADTMPVVRVWSDLALDDSRDGRGVLIITGAPDFRTGFDWDGIILSGRNDPVIDDQNFRVYGMYIGGLAGSDGSLWLDDGGTFYYHSCNVLSAAAKLAHLEPVSGTWWEHLR